MSRILVINPNASTPCSVGIDAAVAPFRTQSGPRIDVVTTPDGPPAIYSWRDWHAAVEPVCRRIDSDPADLYIIACASDPGIEAARAATKAPVLGVFRCAATAAIARADRFGIIAIVEASKGRHLAALRAIGLESRLAAEIALNVSMDILLDPAAARSRLIDAAIACRQAGAQTVILGCTGMAHHRAAIQAAAGIPIIEPCQAAIAHALGIVLTNTHYPG